nr:hypothetical protein [Tanacetum cinerariifolium]
MDKDDVVVLMDEKEEDKKVKEAKVDESAQVQGREAESQAKIYKIDMDHASKEVVDVVTTAKLITEVVTAVSEIVIAASVIISAAEPQVHTATITVVLTKVVAAPSRRRKGVVIRDPKKESTTSSIISIETNPKIKAKAKGLWRVGKGFFRIETPLFEGILVEQAVEEDADKNIEEVNAGDAAHGDVSAAHGEVPTITEEPSIPSPTPHTPPPQPPQDLPSTS